MPFSRLTIGAAALASALTVSACGSTPTEPSTVAASAPTAQFYTGTLQVLGTDTSSTFSISAANTAVVTLGSLTRSSTGAPLASSVKMGIGTSDGTTCTVTTSVAVTPGFVSQVQSPIAAGSFCIGLTDTGGLPEPAVFSIRVVLTNGSGLSTSSTTTTETFATNLSAGGTSGRTFTASGAGTATVTLASAGTSKSLSLAFGIWDGATCRVLKSALTVAGGPALTAPVDGGTYCVKLTDPGVLSDFIGFSITIIRP